jgi:hypothetical protein
MKSGDSAPCSCVFRAIFRVCYARFLRCTHKAKNLSQVSLEFAPKGGGKITWGRKDEEYIADFYLVSRRTLTAEEWKIFSAHFLLGAEWRLCTRQMKMDRGLFFHWVYRIESKLGQTFAELQPYSLYPLDEYFNGRTENDWPRDDKKVVMLRRGSLSRRLKVPGKGEA